MLTKRCKTSGKHNIRRIATIIQTELNELLRWSGGEVNAVVIFMWFYHMKQTCLFGLFHSLREERKKMNWPLLELSALPKLKILPNPNTIKRVLPNSIMEVASHENYCSLCFFSFLRL